MLRNVGYDLTREHLARSLGCQTVSLAAMAAERRYLGPKSIAPLNSRFRSVDVDQSVLGRAFNYGDVTIRGTGQTFEPLRQIDCPIAFRNEVTAR